MNIAAAADTFWEETSLENMTLNSFDLYIKSKIPDCDRQSTHNVFAVKLSKLRDLDLKKTKLVENLSKKLKTSYRCKKNNEIWRAKRPSVNIQDDSTIAASSSSPSKKQKSNESGYSNGSMYLNYGGSFDCGLKLQDKKWVIGEQDVSEKLMEFRKKSLTKGLANEKVSALEILSFNNIFFFSQVRHKSVTKFFPISFDKTISPEINFDEHSEKLPSIVDTWLSNIKDIAERNKIDPVREYLLTILKSEEVKNDKRLYYVTNALYSLAPKFKTWTKGNVSEDTFVKNQFADALDVILGQDNDHEEIQYEWCNKKISSSFLKPDYTIAVEGTDEDHTELFIIEVKAPMRNRSSNDFIKIAFTMKDMLDKLISKGLENPAVMGLLVDGYDCYLYKMSLDYEAVYVMKELKCFQLPKNYDGFPLLKSLLQVIFQAKEFIIRTAVDLDSSISLNEESPMTRPSFSPCKD